jgi:hypothetical protein
MKKLEFYFHNVLLKMIYLFKCIFHKNVSLKYTSVVHTYILKAPSVNLFLKMIFHFLIVKLMENKYWRRLPDILFTSLKRYIQQVECIEQQ